MKNILLVLAMVLAGNEATAQGLFDTNLRWILPLNDVNDNVIYLTPYDESKVALNTMIVRFLPKGKIEYDYESSVEACAGVDFLDLDIEKCSWNYINGNFTLRLRGGYASIDDFNFKRDYKIVYEGEDVKLVKTKTHYYQKRKKDPEFVD